jgi:TRAP-type mannitol/chloroaromatic compound transport system substrate-binding protein
MFKNTFQAGYLSILYSLGYVPRSTQPREMAAAIMNCWYSYGGGVDLI